MSEQRAGQRVMVRPLAPDDLSRADEVMRAAFTAYTGVEDAFGDVEFVRTRFAAAPADALAAELDGELVGSNFVAHWGSFGYFGPLSVRPDLWDQGVASALLGPTMDLLADVRDAGLFTFAASVKHVELYRRFGFWPQHLTFMTGAEVPAGGGSYDGFSSVADKAGALAACADVTDGVLPGLDLRREISSVDAQRLGETVLLHGDGLDGFAVCHAGAGSEAGSGKCHVKFGAVRGGAGAGERFERLLDAVFAYAASAGAELLTLGCNAARDDACRRLFARGFRVRNQGVAMQRDNRPGFNRPDVYAIDDWR